MTTRFRTLLLHTLVVGLSIQSGWAQVSNDAATFAGYKLEEKKNELELYTLGAARRTIEQQYQKMAIAQLNVDIQMLLSLTHPDYKAYGPGGDVWGIKKLEM